MLNISDGGFKDALIIIKPFCGWIVLLQALNFKCWQTFVLKADLMDSAQALSTVWKQDKSNCNQQY